MGPAHPHRHRFLRHDLGDGLPVVAFDPRRHINRRAGTEHIPVVLQTIPAPLFKPGKQIGGPIRLVLIRVVIKRPRLGSCVAAKGLVHPAQIVGDPRRVEQVQHVPAAARGRPLHFLAGRFLAHRINRPTRLGRHPIHRTIGPDPPQQILPLSTGAERHECLRPFHLQILPHRLPGAGMPFTVHHEGVCLGIGDPGSAKAPAGSRGHIHLQAQPPRLPHGVIQHLHPSGAQKRNRVGFPPLRLIYRDDMHPAHPGIPVAPQFLGKVVCVHPAPHPPPVGMRPGRHLLPGPGQILLTRPRTAAEQQRSQGNEHHRPNPPVGCLTLLIVPNHSTHRSVFSDQAPAWPSQAPGGWSGPGF